MLDPQAWREEKRRRDRVWQVTKPKSPSQGQGKIQALRQQQVGNWSKPLTIFQEEWSTWYNKKKYRLERPEFLVPILWLSYHEPGQVTSPCESVFSLIK